MVLPIKTEQLTKSYGPARGVVDLDLEVQAGEVFGFLGPNGAGKSTTIRVLLDFQRPTSGTATVLGLDSRRDSVEVRHRTGYLAGDLTLFPRMTGREHVDWFSKVRGGHDDEFTTSMIDRFGITMDRPVKTLSKGNRQKVGLLLAFMHRPDLLILDEPTSGLDPLVQAEFDALLRETVAEGRTVVLSSHSLDEVQRVADRVAIIREGRLVVTDSVDALRQRSPKLVVMRFAGEPDLPALQAIEGVEQVRVQDGEVRVDVKGDIKPLLRAALDLQLTDLTARHADLDELFLAYYDTPVDEVPGGVADPAAGSPRPDPRSGSSDRDRGFGFPPDVVDEERPDRGGTSAGGLDA